MEYQSDENIVEEKRQRWRPRKEIIRKMEETLEFPELDVDLPFYKDKERKEILKRILYACSTWANHMWQAFAWRISPDTLKKWKWENPWFRDLCDFYKYNIRQLKALKTIYNNLDDVDTAKWFLTKSMPEEYGNKEQVTNTNVSLDLVELVKQLQTWNYNKKETIDAEYTEYEEVKKIENKKQLIVDNNWLPLILEKWKDDEFYWCWLEVFTKEDNSDIKQNIKDLQVFKNIDIDNIKN